MACITLLSVNVIAINGNVFTYTPARNFNGMDQFSFQATDGYVTTDAGVVTCFDAATGAVNYTQHLSTGGQGLTASPVSDGRNVYFTSEQGMVFVVAAANKYSLAGSNELLETCLATPAISEGTLFFRTREKLIAVGPGSGGPR